jgi:hypothetical protein
MATDDSIYIKTELDLESLLKTFFECAEIDEEVYMIREDDVPPRATGIKPDEFWANAYYVRYPPYPIASFLSKQLGFTPNIDIMLTTSKWGDLGMIRAGILKGVLGMMRKYSWDIALSHGDSKIVLLRRKGHVFILRDDPFWTQERLKTFDFPYTLDQIPGV